MVIGGARFLAQVKELQKIFQNPNIPIYAQEQNKWL